MASDGTDVEEVLEQSAEDKAIEQEALDMGWNPQHKGDKFISAKDFVDRGKSILPIVQANNTRLKAEIDAFKARDAAKEDRIRALEAGQAAAEDAREADLAEARKEERAAVKAELARASESGDHAAVADATDELTRLNAEDTEAQRLAKERKAAEGQDTARSQDDRPKPLDPVVKEWLKANQEFARDPERIALGNVIGMKVRQEKPDLKGVAFLDEVADRVEKRLGGQGRQSKVEAGGATGGRSSGSNGKGYADLPADAKAICDKQAAKFVGVGRAHKDEASWRKSYAKQYFAQG